MRDQRSVEVQRDGRTNAVTRIKVTVYANSFDGAWRKMGEAAHELRQRELQTREGETTDA